MTDKALFKTTIVIWSEHNPTVTAKELAYYAEEGEAYCSKMKSEFIPDVTVDPDWDGTEFFDYSEGD